MRVYSAAEVAAEAAILADRHDGPAADMLAYCATVLDAQERQGLRQLHVATTETTVTSEAALTLADAARLVGCNRDRLSEAVTEGLVPSIAFGARRRVYLADVQAWYTARPRRIYPRGVA